MIHAQSIRSGLASALGLFSLLALSACTVGPDYRTPDTAAAKIDATASKPTTAAASKACGGNSSTIRP